MIQSMRLLLAALTGTCLCIAASLPATAQTPYTFTKALAVSAPVRYGREALYMDELAYRLYNHTLQTPVEGASFGTDDNGQPITWKAITADSLNRLRGGGFGFGGGTGRARGASYLYLTYNSPREQVALLNIKGNSSLYLNGEPHMGDAYSLGYLYIPVKLKKGLNELYVRGGFITATLQFPQQPVSLNTEDPTVPAIVLNSGQPKLQAAVVVINATGQPLKNVQLKSILAGKETTTALPVIPAMSTRKVAFTAAVTGVTTEGQQTCTLQLTGNGKIIAAGSLLLDAVAPGKSYSNTFISEIDGSLQYYAVTPQINPAASGHALFLSVHGAGVEAIGQARAYQPKDWGTLVAATNRRPRGFNWEDWGRLDALEVLEIAKQKFQPDPYHIYLTGHSMGGHGTWFLGATYPDKWAAIAPCSGYPTLKGYGSADGLIPDSSSAPLEQLLLRTSNQSDVPRLADNYKPLGIYVLHGDADKVVSVNYARQMRKLLGGFHTDLSYYEYPGGEHWFGDQSVDWKPLFDFFKWHSRLPDTAMNTLDFTTASPGISASYRWATIWQQQHALQYSRLVLSRNKVAKTITGTTTNAYLLTLSLRDFGANAVVKFTLDNTPTVEYTTNSSNDSVWLARQGNQWAIVTAPAAEQKGPHRYGTFKDAFNHRMVFVYGTAGNKEENEWAAAKARYDAETWYYRGNGAVDIVTDKEFSLEKYKDRGVILFGNASTNSAWKTVLGDCPIQVDRNGITAGTQRWLGDDLAAYFVWPLHNSAIASVGAITGTGIKGLKATTANQYFAGASGFPDYMIYSLDMLHSGTKAVKMAGFFDKDWKLSADDNAVNP